MVNQNEYLEVQNCDSQFLFQVAQQMKDLEEMIKDLEAIITRQQKRLQKQNNVIDSLMTYITKVDGCMDSEYLAKNLH